MIDKTKICPQEFCAQKKTSQKRDFKNLGLCKLSFFPQRDELNLTLSMLQSHLGCIFSNTSIPKNAVTIHCRKEGCNENTIERFAPKLGLGCNIPASANLSILGAYFPIHPSSRQCIVTQARLIHPGAPLKSIIWPY